MSPLQTLVSFMKREKRKILARYGYTRGMEQSYEPTVAGLSLLPVLTARVTLSRSRRSASLCRSRPLLGASICLQGDPLWNAAFAASTALSTSGCTTHTGKPQVTRKELDNGTEPPPGCFLVDAVVAKIKLSNKTTFISLLDLNSSLEYVLGLDWAHKQP